MSPTCEFHTRLFEAIPLPIFVLDRDHSIVDFNDAAVSIADPITLSALRPSGHALNCVHAQKHVCGTIPACGTCGIRAAITEGFASDATGRRTVHMNVIRHNEVVSVEFVVTTVPFRDGANRLLMVLLETVTGDRARMAGAGR